MPPAAGRRRARRPLAPAAALLLLPVLLSATLTASTRTVSLTGTTVLTTTTVGRDAGPATATADPTTDAAADPTADGAPGVVAGDGTDPTRVPAGRLSAVPVVAAVPLAPVHPATGPAAPAEAEAPSGSAPAAGSAAHAAPPPPGPGTPGPPGPGTPTDDPAAGGQRAVTPAEFGAVGDGTTDDTVALRRTLGAMGAGDVLVLPRGLTFRHSGVLRIHTPDVTVTGGGTLLATHQVESALMVQADGVTVEDVTLRTTGVTGRLSRYESTRLTVLDADRFTARSVRVEGAAAAGVHLSGAGHFLLSDVHVSGSLADGIHITGSSHDGRLERPVVRASGDDGVAVVSYARDGDPVRRVTVTQPRVLGTTWGRGLSVVGGEDVTFTDVWVEDSDSAAIYVAREGHPYWTSAPARVLVDGGTLLRSNTSSDVDHGAVLVFDGQPGASSMRDITVRGLTIADTNAQRSRVVGFLSGPTSTATGVRLLDLSVTGGPATLLRVTAPPGTWSATGWRRDGVPVTQLP